MELTATARRRWLGAVALLSALVMLIAGETVLKGRLGAVAFLVYWMACFGFTGLALFMALLDMRAVQNRTRQEQKKLVESTLKEIQAQARSKQRRDHRDVRNPADSPMKNAEP